MSKIFEAIRKEHGAISKLVLPMVEVEPDEMPVPLPSDADDVLVEAVLGPDELTGLAVPAAEGAREASLRLPGSLPLLPFDDTHPAAAEQYRIIRTRLIQHPKQPRMLLISSAGPADGKTVTAINIAGALALKSEAKILLVDTDFRRSTIHARLGLPAAPGLAEVLSGTASLEQALVRTEQLPNLYVISAGEPRPNPSELLDSTRWAELCGKLRGMFAYIIADSPPVESVADYDLLQATCDGVVLVVRPDHTKRQLCTKALESIPKDKLIGVVMNCVTDWFLVHSAPYAPYYYGAYNSYGKKADHDSRRESRAK